jgi:hypothetical protein
MSRPSSAALAVVLVLAGCGGSDSPTAPTEAASPPSVATAPPTTATTTPTATVPKVTITLSAPRDGDQYLEGSDARAKFACRNATSCKATVAKAGATPEPVGDGDSLPTKPGRYTFELVATGADGRTARASATYTVPDTPGSGGGDTQLPPGTPEGGP